MTSVVPIGHSKDYGFSRWGLSEDVEHLNADHRH
jgi:hypothetical protein